MHILLHTCAFEYCENLWIYLKYYGLMNNSLRCFSDFKQLQYIFLLWRKTGNTLYDLWFYTFGESVPIFVKQTVWYSSLIYIERQIKSISLVFSTL